jgi:hypothetical protein
MYIDAHGKISRAAKDPVEAGAATPEDQTVVATFDGQAGGAASATVPAVATPRHGPRPASGAKGSKALSTLVRNTQKQTSQQSRAAAGASPAAVAPQPSAQETLEQVFPNPRTPEAPSEEEFLTGLLDDLESSFGSPWSDESKEFSPESLSLQAAEFDASYARVAYPAAGRSYLQAVVFGFLLCSPLLVATFFVHETRTNPAEATGLDRAVIRTLESIGGAVRHAYTKLYDQFSAE